MEKNTIYDDAESQPRKVPAEHCSEHGKDLEGWTVCKNGSKCQAYEQAAVTGDKPWGLGVPLPMDENCMMSGKTKGYAEVKEDDQRMNQDKAPQCFHIEGSW